MPVYTVPSTVTLVQNEGEDAFHVVAAVTRDGTVTVKTITRDFGVTTTNAQIRDAMEAEIKEAVLEDYEQLNFQALQDRAAAIEAALDNWSRTLP